eukprot:8780557-Pyramimonas_sp.AAC.1
METPCSERYLSRRGLAGLRDSTSPAGLTWIGEAMESFAACADDFGNSISLTFTSPKLVGVLR